jgi:hypothetical protein
MLSRSYLVSFNADREPEHAHVLFHGTPNHIVAVLGQIVDCIASEMKIAIELYSKLTLE